MLPRRALAAAAAAVAALAAPPTARANADAEADLLAANKAFHAALSARDLGALDAILARGAETSGVHPRERVLVQGWEAVRALWAGVFERHAELRVAMAEPNATPLAGGRAGFVAGLARFSGHSAEDGARFAFEALATAVFEAREPGKWLLVHHHLTKQAAA